MVELCLLVVVLKRSLRCKKESIQAGEGGVVYFLSVLGPVTINACQVQEPPKHLLNNGIVKEDHRLVIRESGTKESR